MHSLLYTLLSAGVVNAAALVARDTTISTSVRDSTYARSFGQASQLTTVNPGVTYWLSGGGTHNFYGNLDNSGNIIVSQTDYLKQNPYAGGQTADFVGSTSLNGNLINRAGASISLNDFGSASAPTYDWYLNTMENRGSLQFCGRGDTGGSTYQLYCGQTCYNYGVIDFEQYTSNLGASFVWRNNVIGANAGVNVYNEGAFRLVNVVYHNVQNVLGSGCWVIDQSAVLYLEDGSGLFQNPTKGPTFPNQKIYFADAASASGRSQTIHMDTAVYSQNSNFGPAVYGFGGNRAIEFYETIKSFSYANGVLTVIFVSNNQVNIKIGTGYDSTAFYKAQNPQNYNVAGYNAIFYRGNAPSQSVPGVCQVSLGKCTDPAQTAGVSSSSTTSTTLSTTASTTSATTTSASTTVSTTSSTTTSASTTKTSSSSSTTSTVAATTSSSTSSTSSSSSAAATTTSSSSTRSTTSSSSAAPTTTSSSSAAATTTSSSTTRSSTSSSSIAASTTTSPSITATTASQITSVSTSATSTATTATTSTIGNGPCANGAAFSYTYTAANGDVYGVCLKTDFPGPNLTSVPGISTAEQCAETCSKTSNCIAGSLLVSASTCYLKDVRNTASANDGVNSVYKISSGSSSPSTTSRSATTTSSSIISTTTAPTTTKPTTTASTTNAAISSTTTSSASSTTTATSGAGRCPGGRAPDSTYTTSNGDVYGVCLNTDFPGTNLGNPLSNIASPQQCADVCSQTAGCIAGSLVRGSQTCYLKDINNPASTNSNVDSVYKISSGSGSSTTISTSATTTSVSSSASSTSAITTPTSSMSTTRVSSSTLTSTTTTGIATSSTASATTSGPSTTGRCANGKGFDSTYTASNGDLYGVCLGTDFAGPNLGNPVSGITTTSQCAEACSQKSGCIAGSLLGNAQLCYLKDVNNAPVANSGVDSVYKISSGSVGSTTTSANTTTSTSILTSTVTVTSTATTTPATTSFTTTSIVVSTTTVTAMPTSSGCAWVCPTGF